MHPFKMPESYVERIRNRSGRAHVCDSFDPARTALVVVDMQNYFMKDGFMGACPVGRDIVPTVNDLAAAMRKAGASVWWIQNESPWDSLESWSALRNNYKPENVDRRWPHMQPGTEGFALWPTLDVQDNDERVVKQRYSAFIQGSSDIEDRLRAKGVDTLVVVGVATNVCCESTARDAMMRNFKVCMVSDCCAAATDEEHAAGLGNFYLFFGDVQTADEVKSRLSARQAQAAE